MPCEDISETHLLEVNANDTLMSFNAQKNTCGKDILDKKIIRPYIQKDIIDLLSIKIDSDAPIKKRKSIIGLQSCISEFIGFPPPYNHVKTEIQGIEYDQKGNSKVLLSVILEKPIQDIKPCKNGCGTCSTKS